MSDSEERTSVKTYVPRFQKEAWRQHANDLGMSQSEFVRTMVQAGRSDFDVPSLGDEPKNAAVNDPSGRDHSPESGDRSADGGESIETRIRRALRNEDVLDWDELVEAVVGDLESDVDEALGSLQGRNEVRYSGKDGGYVLVTDEE